MSSRRYREGLLAEGDGVFKQKRLEHVLNNRQKLAEIMKLKIHKIIKKISRVGYMNIAEFLFLECVNGQQATAVEKSH